MSSPINRSQILEDMRLKVPEVGPFIQQKHAEKLDKEGRLSPAVNNKRQISKEVFRLARYPFRISTLVDKASAIEYRDPSVETITIPDTLGASAFKYLGFSKMDTPFLYADFLEAKPQLERDYEVCNIVKETLLEFAVQHVRHVWRKYQDFKDAERWILVMMGIKTTIQDIIVDPEYEDDRVYYSLENVVSRTLVNRWSTLHELNNTARWALSNLELERWTPKKVAQSIWQDSEAPGTWIHSPCDDPRFFCRMREGETMCDCGNLELIQSITISD